MTEAKSARPTDCLLQPHERGSAGGQSQRAMSRPHPGFGDCVNPRSMVMCSLFCLLHYSAGIFVNKTWGCVAYNVTLADRSFHQETYGHLNIFAEIKSLNDLASRVFWE